MSSLYDDIARLLGDQLGKRSVVIWYDTRSEFLPFVNELRGAPATELASVALPGGDANLAQFTGSMFEVRSLIEPHVSGDTPDRVVVYVPGRPHEDDGSVLMELERAGETWKPQLLNIVRNLLRKRLTEGPIDDLLEREGLDYPVLVGLCEEGGDTQPSVLKAMFGGEPGSILPRWLSNDERDADIETKGATGELLLLIRSRLSLDLTGTTSLAKARAVTMRYVLGGEFRLDLIGLAPDTLDAIHVPKTKADEEAVRALAQRLRAESPAAYEELADRVEAELGLSASSVSPEALGSIDTFRFEEQVVLGHCGDLIAGRRFDEALAYVAQRAQNFWLDRDVTRRALWEACGLMAELGKAAADVSAEVKGAGGGPVDWVAHYTRAGGWMRLDQAQRRLETFVANIDDAHEHALAVVRQAYEDACQLMADGFSKAFAKDGWSVPGVLHQTDVYGDIVAGQPRPVAYFLVDAMRYEMGVELGARLPKSAEVSIRPAVAALPSITPVGMAALQPGASASFDVVAPGGKIASRIDGAVLPDLSARMKFAASRIPNLVDMTLSDVTTASKTKLHALVAGAQLVIVRSQEIDLAGETGLVHARRVMDFVIDDLARAIRRLADAGVAQAVLSADHGHIFMPEDRDVSMRVEAPGGDTVDLHRRCWIGRGGTTPPGCVRVSAAQLGYASDLDFVFPRGAGVFKAGGDLGFHHGGPSLQELIVPVVTVRSAPTAAPVAKKERLSVTDLPYEINNRVFSVRMTLGGLNLGLLQSVTTVQPVLLSDLTQVGAVGMAVDAEHDRQTGTVTLQPGQPATIAFLLSDDQATSVRIVVRDPATDTELYRSPTEIPVKLGVG